MIRPLLALALFTVPAAAAAADRTFSVGSFDRVRVEGPFDVHLVTAASPRATVSGDPREVDDVEVRQNGTTLVIRHGTGGWGEQSRAGTRVPMVVTLGTPSLVAASVAAGGRLTIVPMRAQHVDLTVSGTAALSVTGIETDQLNATVIGTGTMTLAGKAGRARLIGSGPAVIDAHALDVHDLIVRADGTGETRAVARYTADVLNAGLGNVTIDGAAKCIVRASGSGGPVQCGSTAPALR